MLAEGEDVVDQRELVIAREDQRRMDVGLVRVPVRVGHDHRLVVLREIEQRRLAQTGVEIHADVDRVEKHRR